jgi:hypothetical protein
VRDPYGNDDLEVTPIPLPPQHLKPSKTFRISLIILFLLVYFSGVVVRSRYGLRVVIANQSGATLRDAIVALESKKEYRLGAVSQGRSKTVYVEPAGKDSIRLQFTGANNVRRDELIAAYVENGYCGEVRVKVLPDGRVLANDESYALYHNWWSWLGFI